MARFETIDGQTMDPQLVATTTDDGLMSAGDKSKLDGIAANANKYTHPSTHAATMITQDSTHRFVTDTEKSTWNAKASTAVATTSANGLMSKDDKTKLDGIATGANKYVHPTSSGNKHIPSGGSAGQFLKWSADGTAVWGADNNTTYSVATTSANGLMSAGDKTKLDSITSGANNYVHPSTHPSSMITQDSTHRFVTDTEKSTWNAKVGLDSNGFIPSSVLPSYVDDVIDGYYNSSKFYKTRSGSSGSYTYSNEITGETGKIYINLENNKTYRWSGSAYAVISETLALGETSSTAYAGNKGKANANSITNIINGTTKVGKAGNADTVNGLTVQTAVPANAKFTDTTYSVATTSANGLMSSSDKSKLDGIATGANNYSHPTSSGNKHIPSGGSSGQILRWSADGTAAWGNDNNTTYSDMTGATADAAGAHGLVPAPAKGAANRYLRSDGTWVVPPNTTYSTATTSANGLMSSSDKSKLDGIATGANKYTHPSYTAKSSGLYKVTVDATGHVSATAAVTKADITRLGIPGSDTNTWRAVVDNLTSTATDSSLSANQGKVLKGLVDGKAASSHTHDDRYYTESEVDTKLNAKASTAVATPAANGLMSKDDKTKLNGIAANANNYSHPTSSGNKHIPSGGTSGQILRWNGDGTAVWGNDNNTTYSVATTSANGLMSAADKTKLDGVATLYTGTAEPTSDVGNDGDIYFIITG